jgi:outer membrane protein OmpA-like peptidoglycan-associated protein
MKKIIKVFIVLLAVSNARANVIGTEYQNFAPTYSGLDFTTIESSETLKPCMCSLGLFFNYAKNTLTYSDTYYSGSGNSDLVGQRAKDSLVGADLMMGFGLLKNWDFGLILPFVVTAQNEDPYGVSYFDKFGLTEVRPMTKFRFYGDDVGGLAVSLSANFNTIDNNPFSGQKPGATINIQLMGDTTTEGGLKLAWNVGYRKRNSGAKIVDPETGFPPPFVPLKDSWIFSLGLAKNVESINTDLIAELVGSHTGKLDESDSARKAQQALELNLGLRHNATQTFNLHGGVGTKFANAQASPDIRAYVGAYVHFGPICGAATPNEYPFAVVDNAPVGTSDQTDLSMNVRAKNLEGYMYKIGSTPVMNCSDEVDYSGEIPGTLTIDTNIGEIPDGGITLCVLAKNQSGIWQPLKRPTIVRWIKGAAVARVLPEAIIENYPQGESEETELNINVTAVNPEDYQAYRWKIGSTTTTKCTSPVGYSQEIPGAEPAIPTIKDIPDGGITMCAVAKNLGGQWQPYSKPTIVRWIKKSKLVIIQKNGYELFRLSAEVLFDFDKDNIRRGAQDDLNRIATYLRQKPYKKVIIEGHTDNKGSDIYNQRLSKRRAEAVKKWLIDYYAVTPSKFSAIGQGEKNPVATNATDNGRQQNRRVEFKIYR